MIVGPGVNLTTCALLAGACVDGGRRRLSSLSP